LLLDDTIRANIEGVTGEIDNFMLNSAWEQIINDLGYNPSSGEVTETYFGTDTKFLYLNKRPVTELTSLLINDGEQDVSDVKIYEDIALEAPFVFSRGQSVTRTLLSTVTDLVRYKVTYTAGYTADDFPFSLQIAASMLIQNLQAATDGNNNLSSYKIGDIAYTFKSFAETNESYNAILDKYRAF